MSVIYSLQELLFDVHFWIGQYSSQDEYGTAAYKTVELDTLVSTVHVVDIGRSAGIYTILLPQVKLTEPCMHFYDREVHSLFIVL